MFIETIGRTVKQIIGQKQKIFAFRDFICKELALILIIQAKGLHICVQIELETEKCMLEKPIKKDEIESQKSQSKIKKSAIKKIQRP
jgi:hypothetical protein